jgi:penicillin-binding protein 1A
MKKKKSVLKKTKLRYFQFAIKTVLWFLFVQCIFILSIYLGVWGPIPKKKELSNFNYQMASEVFSSDSVLIGKYYLNDRQPISFQEFPKHLIQALVAVEDERFYAHSGIDFSSLLRVGVKTILMGDSSSGGGSTLTQQLAKNLYPRKDRQSAHLIIDKFKEMIIAKRLESVYSKEEILTHYLNTVSFGDNTFGIESAALTFFNTNAKNLSLEQAATLVGMLKATYSYNPRIFPKKSLDRRNLVLKSMKENNFLDQERLNDAITTALKLDYRDYDYNAGIAPYFREEVRKQLLRWIKERNNKGNNLNLYTSGLKIYTTLNYRMQQLAEEVMVSHMSSLQEDFEKSYGKNAPWLKNSKIIQNAARRTAVYKNLKKTGLNDTQIFQKLRADKKQMTLSTWKEDLNREASTMDSLQHYMKFLNTGSLSLDPATGQVLTWVGGIDFERFKYDHISQSKRQVGSTFKPIVYTAALENGISPCTYFSAQEVAYENFQGWSPSNSGDKEEAFLSYTMEEGLSNSVNTIAVKVMEKTGISNVLEQAKKMGIQEKLPNLPSLALGTGEIKMTEMAMAYTSYLNQGKTVKPLILKKIIDYEGKVLATFESKLSDKPAFSEENGQLMIEMMKSTVNSGTASRIRSTYGLKNDIAGKTGTTQNNKDAWFVALTPKLIHLTWVGLDNHEIGFKNTRLGQGANAALPLFALWLQKLNSDKDFDAITKAKFPSPSEAVLEALNCEGVKRDGFFKRLFKNPSKTKHKKFKNKGKNESD